MNEVPSFLSVSLNSSDTRVVLTTLHEKQLCLQEIRCFQVRMVYINGTYYWDIYDLIREIKRSIIICIKKTGIKPNYISFDSWAHDFGLLDEDDKLIDLPMSYHNFTNPAYMEEVGKIMPFKDIYKITGNNFNSFNSIYQLAYLKQEKSNILNKARKLLFIPDLVNFMLTGVKKTDITYATTSQAYNISENCWDKTIFEKLGIDINIMPEVTKPGQILGDVRPEILNEVGLEKLQVILSAGCDMSSAVTSFAEEGQNWAAIFSGTWVVMGIQLDKPILTTQAMKMSFTNSLGYTDKYFFQKATYGLGLLDKCSNMWIDEVNHLSGQGVTYHPPSFKYLMDMRSPELMSPYNALNSIEKVFKKQNEDAPKTKMEITQCIYESIAFMCHYMLDQIKLFAPEFIERIYVGNDGANNPYLCQCIADATGTSVYASNYLSSIVGNVIIQMMTTGQISSMAEAHKIVDTSIGYKIFEPKKHDMWDDIYYSKFLKLIK